MHSSLVDGQYHLRQMAFVKSFAGVGVAEFMVKSADTRQLVKITADFKHLPDVHTGQKEHNKACYHDDQCELMRDRVVAKALQEIGRR